MAHGAADVATTTTTVRAQTAARLYLLVVNLSDTTVYLKFGDAAVVNEGIPLNPNGGSYEMSSEYGNLDRRAVNAIHAGTGTKRVTWTEYP